MLSLDAIHAKVEQIDRELEEIVEQVVVARDEDAQADAAWKAALAKTRVEIRRRSTMERTKLPAQDALEDAAHEAHPGLYLAHVSAKARVETLRDVLKATTARADLMRTLAASFRSAGG